MPLLSVIVPVYEVEAYLDGCVESVLSQSFADFELILVDDGSPDRCGAMCEAWAAKDGRIRVLHKKSGGLSDARNTGIRAAAGDYLLLLDSDDALLPGALPRLASILRESAPQIVIGQYRTEDETGRLLREKDTELDAARIDGCSADSVVTELREKRVSPCAWRYAVERAYLLREGLWFQKGLLNEDAMWTPRLVCGAERFRLNSVPFYRYRVRSGSIMTTANFKRLTDVLQICEVQYSWARGRSAAQRAYVESLICLLLTSLLQSTAGLTPPQRREIHAWFAAHGPLVQAAARQQKAIRAAARLLGAERALRLAAWAIKCKNRGM